MHTLRIEDLTVFIGEKKILDHFSLTMKSGEIHAIMGPNGTGKSTLSKVIMGDDTYQVKAGNMFFDETDIQTLTTDERARLGLFLGMQMPLAIEGVTNADFLRTACSLKEGTNFKLMHFIKELNQTVEQLKMDPAMIHRDLNVGFSGGERKKNEILQLYLLKPHMVFLDEIDSGLDVDSLKIVGENVMQYYQTEKPGILIITHYERLLTYIKPDFVHIMKEGKIVQSGTADLVKQIEKIGYEKIEEKKQISGACVVGEFQKHE